MEVRRAAENSGLPFFELPAVSAQRIAEALAPLLGLPLPAEEALARQQQQQQGYGQRQHQAATRPSSGKLPKLEPGVVAAGPEQLVAGRPPGSVTVTGHTSTVPGPVAQLQQPGGCSNAGQAPTLLPPAAVAAPVDLLDGVDPLEDRRRLLPSNAYDLQGRRHKLRRTGVPNTQARKRRLQQQQEHERAPW